MVLFSKRIPSKIGFWNAQHFRLIWSFFFYWKNRVFFHIQRGRPFFMTPSLPTSTHVLFFQPPPPPTWGTSFVNGPKSYQIVLIFKYSLVFEKQMDPAIDGWKLTYTVFQFVYFCKYMLVESLLHMVYYRIFYLPHQFSAAIQ